MSEPLFFLSVPGLRRQDLDAMPQTMALFRDADPHRLQHSFPCVTWPSQANMLTGKTATDHGVVANGFYWRDERKVEMWTAWNEVIQRPQIWDTLKTVDDNLTTMAWFPMLAKGCGADVVCMPAPIHQPDGSEDLWCYTRPQEFYGELLEQLGHFPLKHFWGPLANIKSSQWIADAAVKAAEKFRPDFSYIYLPHLDYAAQKFGPNSEEALAALGELDSLIGAFAKQIQQIMGEVEWVIASEYVIGEVDHVSYPNRVLREAGLLQVCQTADDGDREHLDFQRSDAWALVDHQFSHVFVRDSNPATSQRVAEMFREAEGIEQVLLGRDRGALDHERSGDVVLVSSAKSWQAYYWWFDDSLAPSFANTVDIHRKPGYDPVELFFDVETMSVPLDASLIKGSHGVAVDDDECQGVLLSNRKHDHAGAGIMADVDVHEWIVNRFK